MTSSPWRKPGDSHSHERGFLLCWRLPSLVSIQVWELHPYINHWWQTALYVTARGMTTGPIPSGRTTFEIAFDFIDHQLFLFTSQGVMRAMPLIPRSVADFYHEFMALLHAENIEVMINTLPSEVTDPIPCDVNDHDASYDAASVNRFWRILVQVDRVFKEFRSDFIGKNSPVHFFWGAFDLAVTRFVTPHFVVFFSRNLLLFRSVERLAVLLLLL